MKFFFGAILPLFHNTVLPVRVHVETETRFSLRDKRLFEISEVEITRVDCIRKKKLEYIPILLKSISDR